MEIKDRIQTIGNFFREMNVVPGDNGTYLIYIYVTLPERWVIMENTEELYGIEYEADENGYFFWTTTDKADSLFDAIEGNIKINQEAEAKIFLLKQKIEELEAIFADTDNTLEKLQGLTFSFDVSKKPAKPTKNARPLPKKAAQPHKPAEEFTEESTISEEEIEKGL